MSGILSPGLVLPDIRIRFARLLGRGGQGAEIWQVEELDPPRRTLAAKVIHFTSQNRSDERYIAQIEKFDTETAIWSQFDSKSKNVVPLLGRFLSLIKLPDESEYVIHGVLMPLSIEGDLSRQLNTARFRSMPKKELRAFLKDLAEGLKAGQDVNLIHGDVKPTNVLLFKEGEDRVIPQLIDFGSSFGNGLTTLEGGTPEYMAVERFDTKSPTAQADVFSLGIVFCEVITGTKPFKEAEWETEAQRIEKYKLIHAKDEPNLQPVKRRLGPEMENLVQRMLEKDSKKRITLLEVIRVLDNLNEQSIINAYLRSVDEPVLHRDTYRWKTSIHRSLSNSLYYFFIRGTSLKNDPIWLRNRLPQIGVHGFAIYRVLGNFDYVVRAWLKRPYVDRVHEILSEFREDMGGHFLSFAVRKGYLWWENRNTRLIDLVANPTPINAEDKQRLYEMIVGCADKSEERELDALKRKQLVHSKLRNTRRRSSVRFFVTLRSTQIIEDKTVDLCAEILARELVDKHPEASAGADANWLRAREISVLTGGQAFDILLKFRVTHFFEIEKLLDLLIRVRSALPSYVFNSQTFVELEPRTFCESDDGSIIQELNMHASRWQVS